MNIGQDCKYMNVHSNDEVYSRRKNLMTVIIENVHRNKEVYYGKNCMIKDCKVFQIMLQLQYLGL